MLSARFLAQIRQYAALENQLGKDYSSMVLSLASQEIMRLEADGMPHDDAVNAVNVALAQNVKRFPVQWDEIPF